MGTCFSKKGSSSSYSSPVPAPVVPVSAGQPAAAAVVRGPGSPAPKKVPVRQSKQGTGEPEEETFVKKEVFVIKHRKSHDRDSGGRVTAPLPPDHKEESEADGSEAAAGNNVGASAVNLGVGVGIRTSSCTKEEVESILIQCGRLSHSGGSSSGKPAAGSASGSRSRRYSGSKRSYDFDRANEDGGGVRVTDVAAGDEDEGRQHRQLSRPSPRHGSRRRTPSRERDQQRSGSTERRRVSRSPGRRSEITPASAASSAGASDKPGKLVSVPATVLSPAEPTAQAATASVRRITVKRNVGEGGRSAVSPRSQSPARAKDSPQQAPLALSRNSSRKAEHSPYRRNPSGDTDPSRKHEQSPYRRNPSTDTDPSRKHDNSPYRRTPLTEIDHNKVAPYTTSKAQTRNNKENEGLENITTTQVTVLKPNVEPNNKKAIQGTLSKVEVGTGNPEQQLQAAVAEADNQKPQKVTRSRSARRSSGHIEFSPEVPPNTTSYTNLLLEDIQNFHQTNPTPNPASITLPACVTKAHSIFQAVADLNSNTGSSISTALSEDNRSQPQPSYQFSSNCLKDPFVESEVGVDDDLMEPSIHKYVTVKRGGSSNSTALKGGDRDELESSGSNSFMGSVQNQWEPGSADSSECWTSSSTSRPGLPSNSAPELDDARRKMGGKRRDGASEQNGIGRGRVRCR